MEQCSTKSLNDKLLFVENKLVEILKCPSAEKKTLIREFSRFKAEFKRRWTAARYRRNIFNSANVEWLNCKIQFTFWGNLTSRGGRPTKQFGNSSERSKRRKTLELRNTVSVDELTFAAQMSQRAAGNTAASNVIKTIGACPSTAVKLNQVIVHPHANTPHKHTAEEALGIFVEANLSRKQYEIIHASNKSLYPCYSVLQKQRQNVTRKKKPFQFPKRSQKNVFRTC